MEKVAVLLCQVRLYLRQERCGTTRLHIFPPNPKYMALHFRDLRPPCNPGLQQGISLGEVRRAEPAFWFYEVTEKQFRRALQLSLQEAGLLASGQGRYTLSAHLLHMAVPLAGRDTKILASVLYTSGIKR